MAQTIIQSFCCVTARFISFADTFVSNNFCTPIITLFDSPNVHSSPSYDWPRFVPLFVPKNNMPLPRHFRFRNPHTVRSVFGTTPWTLQVLFVITKHLREDPKLTMRGLLELIHFYIFKRNNPPSNITYYLHTNPDRHHNRRLQHD